MGELLQGEGNNVAMTAMDHVVLRQVRVIDPVAQRDEPQDVWLEQGKLRAIAPQLVELPESVKRIDASKYFLGPGLVDLYSHSGEPGYESRETLLQLSQGAIAGGFTQVGILPDTQPCLDNLAQLTSLTQRIDQLPAPKPQLLPWAALTQSCLGEQLTELLELSSDSISGFSDGCAHHDWRLLRRTLEYLRPHQKPIALVPQTLALSQGGIARTGEASLVYGLPEELSAVETMAIAALCELVAELQTPIHLMRISTARGVELIAEAKQRGLPITASVTWMHLLWNSHNLSTYDPNLRLNPPLGNPADQQALVAGVKSGTLEAIAIDHQAYTYEEKTVSFAEAPPGVLGLEIAFPLLWENLVQSQGWQPLELWQALSTGPKKCLGHDVAAIAPDISQPLILFDPHQPWPINSGTLHSHQTNTPWWQKTIAGKVMHVFSDKQV